MTSPAHIVGGLTVTEEEKAEEAVAKTIAGGLDSYNETTFGPYGDARLWLVGRDGGGAVQAGVKAITYWQWLFVEWLWIAEGFRRRGLGSWLLQRCETVARERGCIGAYLDTFSFQAPEFYRRQGYEEFGRLDGLPPGHARIWFRKAL